MRIVILTSTILLVFGCNNSIEGSACVEVAGTGGRTGLIVKSTYSSNIIRMHDTGHLEKFRVDYLLRAECKESK